VYLRRALNCAYGWADTAEGFIAQFEADWPALEAFLLGLPATTVGQELRARVELEQYGRGLIGDFVERFGSLELTEARTQRLAAKIMAADVANTARLKEILTGRTWLDDAIDGPGAQAYGFLIVQHADADPAFQADMLGRLDQYVGTERAPRFNYALLWDRVAVAQGRPQRFATQVQCRAGVIVPTIGVEDESGLNQRREAFDILQTWEEYAEMMRVWTGCRPD
jgi:hypothetical protein